MAKRAVNALLQFFTSTPPLGRANSVLIMWPTHGYHTHEVTQKEGVGRSLFYPNNKTRQYLDSLFLTHGCSTNYGSTYLCSALNT